jgi:CheY-like chemotaxis protein
VARVRQILERQVGNMVRLIDDLLDVSRITTGKIQLQRKPTPLLDLVSAAVEANRPAIDAAGLELTVTMPEIACLLDVDPTRFVQVLSNLLHNATKFTPAGGHVHLSASLCSSKADDGRPELELRVADDGVGISPDTLPRVFELFAQGEASGDLQAASGLGIGLALARRLIDMHGGRIDARSDGSGRGSVFTIHLPVAPATSVREEDRAEGTAPHHVARRVVIIDDNADAAAMLAMLIGDLGGEVHVAHDGAAGAELVQRIRPDVVLLDIGMPAMDGYETCRRIRSESSVRDLFIVALTGWGQEQDKQRAHDAGFDAHLTKPADPASLARLLADPPKQLPSTRTS